MRSRVPHHTYTTPAKMVRPRQSPIGNQHRHSQLWKKAPPAYPPRRDQWKCGDRAVRDGNRIDWICEDSSEEEKGNGVCDNIAAFGMNMAERVRPGQMEKTV